MRSDETSFFCPEITCVFIFCIVAGHALWRTQIPIGEDTKNKRKSKTPVSRNRVGILS